MEHALWNGRSSQLESLRRVSDPRHRAASGGSGIASAAVSAGPTCSFRVLASLSNVLEFPVRERVESEHGVGARENAAQGLRRRALATYRGGSTKRRVECRARRA